MGEEHTVALSGWLIQFVVTAAQSAAVRSYALSPLNPLRNGESWWPER